MASKSRRATEHDRSCQLCGDTYTANRANSRYCSGRCVKRAQRVKPALTGALLALQKWLVKHGLAVAVDKGALALTVSPALVLKELNAAANRLLRERGLRLAAPTTEAGLKAAMREMGIASS